jgi:hypothetical protein
MPMEDLPLGQVFIGMEINCAILVDVEGDFAVCYDISVGQSFSVY